MNILENGQQLISKYDLFLVDLWGVTHNGEAPFRGALDFFERSRGEGKKIVLLSNAPRLIKPAAARLTEMGITPDLYDGMITSGDHCRKNLQEKTNPFYKELGYRLYFFGPDKDKSLIEHLEGYEIVKALNEADFILLSGPLNWDEEPEALRPFLERCLKQNLPLICPNADNQALVGETLITCGGRIARYYQGMGGKVYIHGKPDPEIFALSHKLYPDTPREKILMIGDSLETDIKGAKQYGIDSLLVLTGIIGREVAFRKGSPVGNYKPSIDKLTKFYEAQPTYLAPAL
jgi:HAD superfamily hydrolase (TIGR01459 family)